MSEDLSGKTILVTGAASGIGRALVLLCARRGARVAALDVDRVGLQALPGDLAGTSGEILPVHCNVVDAGECMAALREVTAKWGDVDVLVNCAGITHRSLFAETSVDVIRRVVEVNFFGSVNCTSAALESVMRRRGVIVAISSVAGFAPLIGRTGYAASKHALHGFFDTLRAELEPSGVRVLLVCPTYTDTPLDGRALAGDGTVLDRKKPIVGKLLTADEVAGAIVRAIGSRRRLLLLSSTAKAAYWVSRLFPRLFARLMVATHRSEFEGGQSRARPT